MIDVALQSDVGRQRTVNQDAGAVREVAGGLLLLVADGMGGHQAGEQAARLVVEGVIARFAAADEADPREVLRDGLLHAHREVLAHATLHSTHGMGSTAVVAFVLHDDIWVAHVGDSRFYQLRDGAVHRCTVDHTRVQMLVELRALTAAQAKDHPDANVITRAVGHDRQDGSARGFEPEVRSEPYELEPGDTLVLCSDGLHGLVDDEEIIAAVAGRGAQEACDRLVELANGRGGDDNITVVVLHADGGTGPPEPTSHRGDNTVDDAVVRTLGDDEPDSTEELLGARVATPAGVRIPGRAGVEVAPGVPPAAMGEGEPSAHLPKRRGWTVLMLVVGAALVLAALILGALRPNPENDHVEPATEAPMRGDSPK